MTVKSGSTHYKKDDLSDCWASSLDISGCHTALLEQGRGVARHGICELTHGMPCVNQPLVTVLVALCVLKMFSFPSLCALYVLLMM